MKSVSELPTLGSGVLRAEIRQAEYLIDKSRDAGDDAWRWWMVYRDYARRELASRPPDPDRPKGGRKPCEVLPDPRALGEQRQAQLWAYADEALADLRAERRGAGGLRRGASVPPPTAPDRSPAIGSEQARGLIAALKAQKRMQ